MTVGGQLVRKTILFDGPAVRRISCIRRLATGGLWRGDCAAASGEAAARVMARNASKRRSPARRGSTMEGSAGRLKNLPGHHLVYFYFFFFFAAFFAGAFFLAAFFAVAIFTSS